MATDRSPWRVDITAHAPVPVSVNDIKDVTVCFLKSLKVRRADISIVFVKDADMRRLNKASLGHDYVTDIITFDLSDGKEGLLEGELVICPAQARRNARACAETFEREVLRYIAHGLLHLKGYDDATDAERARMRKKENSLLGLAFNVVAGHRAGHLMR
ncbi:MAG: rRNA maturation RNase YbeY [Candidatus Omnitrophota bacterium]